MEMVRRGWELPRVVCAMAVFVALVACNGTAMVTMTSTASQDSFLAYRVALSSVELQSSSGKSTLKILPASATVDLVTLTNLTEVIGAATVAKGSYTTAIVTLDYSAAQIIYDDGTVNGVALAPVGANGAAVGTVTLTIALDPSQQFSVVKSSASLLALDFKLAASNLVNLAAKTVTVTPFIAASAMPIDTKLVRIRGPIAVVDSSNSNFSMGIVPFNSSGSSGGSLTITPSDVTTYEIGGIASTGSAGLTQLAGLSAGSLGLAYGSLTTATDVGTDTDDETTTTVNGVTTVTEGTTTTPSSTNVSFAATQVLAGSSVQGSGFDRVTGIVAARSGDTLAIEDGTLVANDGTETFLQGTTTVALSANTVVTYFGQGTTEVNSPLQVSIGSSVDTFGTVTALSSSGSATLDASAGRARVSATTAMGMVSALGSDELTMSLTSLGGRSAAIFDFSGTNASAADYVVGTGGLALTNLSASPSTPVTVSGLPAAFGSAPPDFAASALLDPTTIQAELVIAWGSGTAAPFTTYDSSTIDVDIKNASIGAQHFVQVGAQMIDVTALPADLLIVPDATSSDVLYAIGHSVSGSVESFNTYAAFITQLQTELTGSVLATGVTALGPYTALSYTLTASSITVFLNN